jgi:hypothetical protein
MIKIDENYTDYRDDSDENYTCGKAIDAEDEESFEATPIKAALVNDIIGAFRSVYKRAFGNLNITNVPDNENTSDFLGALLKLIFDSPAFINNPTAPTQNQIDNSTKLATTAFVKSAITALIDSSPATLDTLKELADALGDDPNFATTMTNALAGKAPINATLSDQAESSTLPATTSTALTDLLQAVRNYLKYLNNKKAPLASPSLTGTPTAPTAAEGTNNTQVATTAFVQTGLNDIANYARDLKPNTTTVIDKTNIFANPPLNIMHPLHHIAVHYYSDEDYKQPVLAIPTHWEILTLCTSESRALQMAFECYDTTPRRLFIRRRHVDNIDYTQWGDWIDMALKDDVDTEATARASADAALQTHLEWYADNSVANEANLRYNQDIALQNGISNETSARASADSTIYNRSFPVGKVIIQYPDEPSPVEAGIPGSWELWTNRAIIYGLSASSGGSVGVYVERQKCGNALTAGDFGIGTMITSGTYTGYYVREVITPAGKFFGVDGGNRPTFVSGGVQGGRIINITGDGIVALKSKISGAIKQGSNTDYNGGGYYFSVSQFDASSVVPTGADNAPINVSVRYWRRIA